MIRHAPSKAASDSADALTRYRIPTGWVKLGMYVADLDRPWLDTPFFLQGFVISSALEIETLQKFCQTVVVDIERSRPEIRVAILERGEQLVGEAEAKDARAAPDSAGPAPVASEAANPTKSSHSQPRKPLATTNPQVGSAGRPADRVAIPQASRTVASDARSPATASARAPGPVEQTRSRHAQRPQRTRPAPARASRDDARRKLKRAAGAGPLSRESAPRPTPWLESVWQTIRALFGRGPNDAGTTAAPVAVLSELEREVRAAVPAGETVRHWPDRWPVEEEIPRAREVYERSETALAEIFADVQAGRIPQIEQVEDVMSHVVSSMIDNPDALLWVAHMRERHEKSYRHAMRVALYMVALGRQLGFPRAQLSQLGSLGLLADIGKTRIPQALLEKPGMLGPAEFEIVKEHVELGIEMLEQAGGLAAEIVEGIAQHHERIDGSGYPHNLAGSQISLFGRMAAIVDSFTAMTSSRSYADPVPPHEAMMSLFAFAGTSFHEPLVEQFVQAVGVFPVGSLVELSSGEVAIVLAHNRARRLEPRVLLLTDAKKVHLPTPSECDLFKRRADESGPPVRILKGLAAGAHGLSPQDYYAQVEAESDALA